MDVNDDVIAEARSRTGLSHLGNESFHDGLVALFKGAADAGSFNELGMAVLRDQAIGLLSVRLQVEDWYRRHPEIDEQQILGPLFGLGLPRTGSTALSFLLAEDPGARSLLAWESMAPAPPPDPTTYDTDPRIAEMALQMSLIDGMAPKFKSMLPSAPTGPTECLQLMALDFRSAMFAALGDNRYYDHWLTECDMLSAYRYHQRVLKLLQWRFPTKPWRLKSPAHMNSLDALLVVYPDARFVMTHRDIVQVMPSLVSLLDATSEFMRDGPLAADFAAHQASYWERGLRETLAYRDGGNEAPVLRHRLHRDASQSPTSDCPALRLAGRGSDGQRGRPDARLVGGEPARQARRARLPPERVRHRSRRFTDPVRLLQRTL